MMNGSNASLTVRSNCDWDAVLKVDAAVASVDGSIHTGSKTGTPLNFIMKTVLQSTAQSEIEIRPSHPSLSPIIAIINGINGFLYTYNGKDYFAEYNNRLRIWPRGAGTPENPCPAGYFVPSIEHYVALVTTHNNAGLYDTKSSSYGEEYNRGLWYITVMRYLYGPSKAYVVSCSPIKCFSKWTAKGATNSDMEVENFTLYDEVLYRGGQQGLLYEGVYNDYYLWNYWRLWAIQPLIPPDYGFVLDSKHMAWFYYHANSKYASPWTSGTDYVRCVKQLTP